MSALNFFVNIKDLFAVPATFLFFAVGIILTIKHGFLQIRALPRFIRLITQGVGRKKKNDIKTINAFHALFTAMSTTIGVGNVVGPSLAIIVGGPGALFWLVIYMFFASATKYTEVVLALRFRQKTADGRILGGPTEYLKAFHPFFGRWYGALTIFLFAGWSGIQANALAEILAQQHVAHWFTGAILAVLVFVVLMGGAKRVGQISSKIVPVMFPLYVIFALLILLKNPQQLVQAFKLIFSHIFSPAAAVGGFVGSTVFAAVREGTYRAVFISEAGVGTSSIPHSMSDVDDPTDQGILAMFSMTADAFLCILSGLLVLVTGLWQSGEFTTTTIYYIFAMHYPIIGPLVFLFCLILFIVGTAIGNSFNGSQSFASFTRYRWITGYYVFVAFAIFLGAITNVPLIWAIMDVVLPLVAIPNLIGVLVLAFRYPRKLGDER